MPLLAAVLLAMVTGAAGAGGSSYEQSVLRASAPQAFPDRDVVVLGESAQGRTVKALRLGDRDGRRKALAVGVIHGDETAGLKVIRQLRRRFEDVRGVDLWTVYSINPDGIARGTRRNARGVDLNRNFSRRWSNDEPPSSPYYGGPFPFSEPESKLVRRLIRRLRPALTIWYHQPWGQVLAPCRGDAGLERRYSWISGLPLRRCRGEGLPGTATRWQEHRFPRSSAFVVELAAGSIGNRAARRHARAAAIVAQRGATDKRDTPARTSSRRFGSGNALDRIKPRIVDWPIPYGPERKRDMAGYSKRHYGNFEWRLRRVEHVVQHYAVTNSAQTVFNTFAPNRPDVEYGELPGVCSHYVINRRGRIFRLIGLRTRCRHTVGLNHRSVGIEHTGYSDAQVIGNRRQLRASLRLTRWLRCRFALRAKRVIGHNESLSSPFYRELDPRFRGRTHGDFRPATMDRYRRELRRLGACPSEG